MESMLPKFTYHPDPLATGAVGVSDRTCECCGQARGYIYTASVYRFVCRHCSRVRYNGDCD